MEKVMTQSDTQSDQLHREGQDTRDSAAVRLGQRLRRARLQRNLTQGEVAKNQFSVSYVSAVERGQIRPSLGALEKLAERLQVPVTDLLGDDERLGHGPAERREPIADRQRDEMEARLLEAQRLLGNGSPEAVRDAVESLTRLSSRQLGPRELAQVYLQLARAHLQQGRGDEARDAAQKGLSQAERAGDADLTERLRFELGSAYAQLQSYTLAAESLRKCLHSAEDGTVRDPLFRMSVLLGLGAVARGLGQQDEAVHYLQRAAEAARTAVSPRALAEAYGALSHSYATKGETSLARYYAIRSIAAYDEARTRRQIAIVHAQYGRALAQVGRMDDAYSELELAREIAVAQQDPQGIAEARRAQALLFLRENRVDDAARAAEESAAQAETMQDPTQRAESLLTLAQVSEHRQDFAGAERDYDEAISLLREAQAHDLLAAAYTQASQFYERRGDDRKAFELLKQAHSLTAPAALRM